MSIYNDSRRYEDGDAYDQWKSEAEWEARQQEWLDHEEAMKSYDIKTEVEDEDEDGLEGRGQDTLQELEGLKTDSVDPEHGRIRSDGDRLLGYE